MAGLAKLEYCTYGDYCSWRDDQRREIIDGVPYNMTAPSRQHAEISRELGFQFVSFFRGRPCQVYSALFDVRLPRGNEADDEIDTVVQPDLLVVCDEKKLDDLGCRGAPDLIIAILSPSTAARDCIQKRSLYERHGVREFWTVDPVNRIVSVYLIELVEAAVSMAIADGEVSPEEQQYLETLMKKFGYTKTELNMALRKAENRQKLEKTAKKGRNR